MLAESHFYGNLSPGAPLRTNIRCSETRGIYDVCKQCNKHDRGNVWWALKYSLWEKVSNYIYKYIITHKTKQY